MKTSAGNYTKSELMKTQTSFYQYWSHNGTYIGKWWVSDLIKWTTCVPHFQGIPHLPVLMVNAYDDPVISPELHKYPILFTSM